MFQSSLELSPECNLGSLGRADCTALFQSSLELSPECNLVVISAVLAPNPRFQSSLELSPECNISSSDRHPIGEVSILTRAFARVQQCHPWHRWRVVTSFNPHSSFRPSATLGKSKSGRELSVSILTRAFARVQQRGSLRMSSQ